MSLTSSWIGCLVKASTLGCLSDRRDPRLSGPTAPALLDSSSGGLMDPRPRLERAGRTWRRVRQQWLLPLLSSLVSPSSRTRMADKVCEADSTPDQAPASDSYNGSTLRSGATVVFLQGDEGKGTQGTHSGFGLCISGAGV